MHCLDTSEIEKITADMDEDESGTIEMEEFMGAMKNASLQISGHLDINEGSGTFSSACALNSSPPAPAAPLIAYLPPLTTHLLIPPPLPSSFLDPRIPPPPVSSSDFSVQCSRSPVVRQVPTRQDAQTTSSMTFTSPPREGR
eukprot:257701-Hanusia_phi.AAC.2